MNKLLISKEREELGKTIGGPFRQPVPPSTTLPQSSTTRSRIDNLLQPVCERRC
ncbi:hypothetical protein ES319_A10G159300v1 [Gossypium barbadense]|uniref:Uncharacterized protein n=2 Tax=Gossypium TaxID=3633 RepID=A0A5J5U495_GOSBA|nr:hypothetical protein ES319_A10G159300v1 [Gossypium barbadense]TYI06698.1 hypothetical protein ES332_A10G177100v1 [Gossypium tomentosum]